LQIDLSIALDFDLTIAGEDPLCDWIRLIVNEPIEVVVNIYI
jgi:hypothetical protein